MMMQVEDLMSEVLRGALFDTTYEPSLLQTIGKNLANVIRKRVREVCNPVRYKYVVMVHLGSRKDSSISIVSRAVWFPESGDNYASVTYSNPSVFGVAMVFATFFE
ncbi:unnamed protein product [Protopolystoma xenopodis]|uniref:Uncharacterized protein n=1 Tax=Protopolystoma xenopodis TaxID=117903 RepID=A0A448WXE8_9PLAT|nr:unnamed protein product [Protopolystoma xenopodis]